MLIAKLAVGATALTVLAFVANTFTPTTTAQSLERASAHITKTETKIADKVAASQQAAEQVSREIEAKDADSVPRQIQQMGKVRGQIRSLKEQFERNLQEFETACETNRAEFQKNAEGIQDESYKPFVSGLRGRLNRSCASRVAMAHNTLAEMNGVLSQYEDVERLARMIDIVNVAEAASSTLATQIQQVKLATSEYSRRTGALLAMLNQDVQLGS